jgi:hypothetical protein
MQEDLDPNLAALPMMAVLIVPERATVVAITTLVILSLMRRSDVPSSHAEVLASSE